MILAQHVLTITVFVNKLWFVNLSRQGRAKIYRLLKHSLIDYMEYFYEVTWDTWISLAESRRGELCACGLHAGWELRPGGCASPRRGEAPLRVLSCTAHAGRVAAEFPCSRGSCPRPISTKVQLELGRHILMLLAHVTTTTTKSTSCRYPL